MILLCAHKYTGEKQWINQSLDCLSAYNRSLSSNDQGISQDSSSRLLTVENSSLTMHKLDPESKLAKCTNKTTNWKRKSPDRLSSSATRESLQEPPLPQKWTFRQHSPIGSVGISREPPKLLKNNFQKLKTWLIYI